METHLGISALVTRASIPGGTIVAIGTALIVDQKLVNLIVRTSYQRHNTRNLSEILRVGLT